MSPLPPWPGEPDGATMGEAGVHNPLGRPALAYRGGTARSFHAEMLVRVRSESVPGGLDGKASALVRLNVAIEETWVVALLHAWSLAGDVLTFYTERIANEGFLRTAREELSVGELVRLLGYRLQPGAASAASVSLALADLKGRPLRAVMPKGTRIQSLPAPGRLPQIFETVEEVEARSDWNALKLRVPTLLTPQVLRGAATSLLLAATMTGLKSGDPLLLFAQARTEEGTAERSYFRAVRKVDAPRAARSPRDATRVSWQGTLKPADRDAVLSGLRAYTLRKRAALFGHDAPAWKDEPDDVRRQYMPVQGGVLLGSRAWTSWQSINEGLPAAPVTALAACDGTLLAGTAGQGVCRSTDGGASWQASSRNLAGKEIRCLLVDSREYFFAGSADGGIFRSLDRGASWESVQGSIVVKKSRRRWTDTRLPRTAIRCLGSATYGGETHLFAGTDQGLFRSILDGGGWEPASSGLPNTSPDSGFADLPVRAIALSALPGLAFLGTDQGVFRSANFGSSWTAANQGLPGTDRKTGLTATAVQALAIDEDRRTRATLLLAGTSQGVFTSNDLGESWRPASRGLPGTDPHTGLSTAVVQCLARWADPRTLATDLFAGTSAGLFVSGDQGGTWSPFGGKQAAVPIAALALDEQGGLLAATPLGGAGGDEWPGFHITGGKVDLDAVYPQIAEGSWLVLYQPREGEGPLQGTYRIQGVATVYRDDFTLEGVVTRLAVEEGEDLAAFDLRTTSAFVQSEPLDLYVQETVKLQPLGPDRCELAQPLAQRFGAARPVFVAGKSLRARLASGGVLVPDAVGQVPILLGPEDEVQVLAFPQESGGRLSLRVQGAGGVTGTVGAAADEVVWQPAAATDATVVELTAADDMPVAAPGGASASVLVLDPPLASCFDPQTVTVSANVARVTQGATASREILGSGDPAQSNQRFTLSQPLTYLPASPAHATSIVSTLEVRVEGVLWREVPSLYTAGPHDTVYMLRTDSKGRTVVLFGDGERGARLPAGRDNVVAAYRTGMSGEPVPAGHLSVLQSRPFGLRSVTNPLAVAPGTPAEPRSDVRWRAPLSVRALDRIVSQDDYEDFARTFPGISKVEGRALWTGRGHLLQVTVAASDGRDLGPDDDLYQGLIAAMAAARASDRPMRVDSYQRVLFMVAATLIVDPRDLARTVAAAARAALAATFSFASSRFGQAVSSSEVIDILEAVPGVAAVRLEAFCEAGAVPPRICPRLCAREARYDCVSGLLTPAQLVMIDRGGIRLSTEGGS